MAVRMPSAGEPGLQQRRVGRDGEKRQAYGDREQAELPQVGLAGRRLAPGGGQADRQRQQRQQANAKMDGPGQRRRRLGNQQMRVAVADEQRSLEEADGDRPNRRRAAEHRQHHLGEHRLHGEQQQRREEGGGRIRPKDEVGTLWRRRRRRGRCPFDLGLLGDPHAGVGHPLITPCAKAPADAATGVAHPPAGRPLAAPRRRHPLSRPLPSPCSAVARSGVYGQAMRPQQGS